MEVPVELAQIIINEEADQQIIFDTGVGYKVRLDDDHPLIMKIRGVVGAPYVVVRERLEARLTRSVYYRLVQIGEEYAIGPQKCYGVRSCGGFFALGEVTW